jgi:hypothetical protein
MGNQNPNASGGWQSSATPDASKLAGQAEKAAEQLANSALERVQQAREKAESGLSEQRGLVTQRIRRVSDALRATSDELRLEDEVVADYLEQAGDRVERIASYVSSAKAADIAHDVQRFASERPAWFFGGTFLLGMAAGRFLKSSAATAEQRASEEPRLTSESSQSAQTGAYGQVQHSSVSPTGAERPMSSAGYSEPRVYGSPGANGDKANDGTKPVTGPGSRSS